MAWTVYTTTADRLVVRGVPNEAIADAGVTALGAGHAKQRVNDADGNETGLPAWFFPGVYVDTGGVLHAEPPLSDVGRLQEAARGASAGLVGLSRAARDLVGRVFSSADHARVHDWVVFSFHGLARVCRSTHWTIAQRIAFCAAFPKAADVLAFYEQAVGAVAPSAAVLLANPDTGAQVALADAGAVTMGALAHFGLEPTRAELVGAGWVDDLAV